jgi:hypothetical protein
MSSETTGCREAVSTTLSHHGAGDVASPDAKRCKADMAKKQARIPANLQPWIDARRKFHLSHEQVQMARELGMNPKKLGKLNNHDQEPWKLPLREFLAKIYFKRFGKARPDAVRSIEETAAAKQAKKQAKKATRDAARRVVERRDDPTQ